MEGHYSTGTSLVLRKEVYVFDVVVDTGAEREKKRIGITDRVPSLRSLCQCKYTPLYYLTVYKRAKEVVSRSSFHPDCKDGDK